MIIIKGASKTKQLNATSTSTTRFDVPPTGLV